MKPIDIRIITRYLIGRHHLWSIHLIRHLVRNLICRLAITHLGKFVWVGLSHMTKTLGQLRTIFKNVGFGWDYFCIKPINWSRFLKTKNILLDFENFWSFFLKIFFNIFFLNFFGNFYGSENHTFASVYYEPLEYIWNQPMSFDYQSGANFVAGSTYYSHFSLCFVFPQGGTVAPNIKQR